MQTTTAHVLRRAGYGVLQADHATAALELLRGVTGSCIRVMLVDVDLAGDEAHLLSRAAQNLKTNLQVIYVGRARAGSSEDLLTKPFTAGELLLAVARRLGAPSPR
jgi:DNA-binding response OmpR family regulator